MLRTILVSTGYALLAHLLSLILLAVLWFLAAATMGYGLIAVHVFPPLAWINWLPIAVILFRGLAGRQPAKILAFPLFIALWLIPSLAWRTHTALQTHPERLPQLTEIGRVDAFSVLGNADWKVLEHHLLNGRVERIVEVSRGNGGPPRLYAFGDLDWDDMRIFEWRALPLADCVAAGIEPYADAFVAGAGRLACLQRTANPETVPNPVFGEVLGEEGNRHWLHLRGRFEFDPVDGARIEIDERVDYHHRVSRPVASYLPHFAVGHERGDRVSPWAPGATAPFARIPAADPIPDFGDVIAGMWREEGEAGVFRFPRDRLVVRHDWAAQRDAFFSTHSPQVLSAHLEDRFTALEQAEALYGEPLAELRRGLIVYSIALCEVAPLGPVTEAAVRNIQLPDQAYYGGDYPYLQRLHEDCRTRLQ